MINYRILANMLLLIPVVAFFGTYLSHKIAGPIYRLEKYLSDMTAGKLTSHITLRKGDEFVSLANKINELTDSLRATLANQRESLRKVMAELSAVKKMADSKTASIAQIDSNIDRISNEMLALERELDKFKT
jgi:methyl-accepting chemotaxis protein